IKYFPNMSGSRAVVGDAKLPTIVNLLTDRFDCPSQKRLWRIVDGHDDRNQWSTRERLYAAAQVVLIRLRHRIVEFDPMLVVRACRAAQLRGQPARSVGSKCRERPLHPASQIGRAVYAVPTMTDDQSGIVLD